MAPRTPKDPETKPARPSKAEKPAAKPKAAAKPASQAEASGADGGTAAKASNLRLRDLVDMVTAATGGKKPEVKKTIDATLKAIGEALAKGTALTIPPLGKLRVVKNKGPAMTLKLRLADGAKAAGLALADDEEDS